MDWSTILLWIYYAVLSLSVLTGLLLWSYLDKAGKVVWAILLITFLVEAIRAVFRTPFPIVNKVLLIIVPIIEMLVFSYLYLSTTRVKAEKRWMIILSLLVACIVIGNGLFLQPFPQPQLNLYQFESVFLSIMAVHALYCLAATPLPNGLQKNPLFWFWAMILIYQCSTLGFWGSQKLLQMRSARIVAIVDDLQVMMNIIQYTGMAYGLFLYKSKSRSPG